ncbi:aminotransferase class IV [Streptomyces sp. NRRL B-1347]|uniref:aminotransferase class IV n=1 Tax=Streptomyces sp. NRRL B-1347 TaxID=1476877 RepID=UPI0007C4DE1A|nr:aminotransferase class IV [Streptomyces sp. NRRL B-1347]
MPSQQTAWFAWRPGSHLAPASPPDAPVLAADSWLVQGGRARFTAGHRARFLAACRAAGAGPGLDAGGFFTQVLARLPRTGAWFPRVELLGGARPVLGLRLRPSPARTAQVRLGCWYGPDPRTCPRRKGPDLAALGTLRAHALDRGADDYLLTTPGGWVSESTSATLLWWEGERLCLPAPGLPVLPGITAAWITARATRLGIPLAARPARPADLSGHEVWLVNALHGIRPVTAWPHTPYRACLLYTSPSPRDRG